jgi:N-acetylglucosaminyl-diphospho-decaprenol L-rhamnosyltransferase
MSNRELAIVIVTYNSSAVIERCLSNLDFEEYDVLVVDNASSDNTLSLIENKFPKVGIIKADKNLGYGRGNNLALKSLETEFALILNPDAVIFKNDIKKLISAIKSDESIAMAGPIILKNNPLQQEELDNKISAINRDFMGVKYDYYEMIKDYFSVRFVVGAAAILRLSILRKIGFYNEEFFLYYEDDELCKRIIKNGYKNIIVPKAIAFHVEGKSCGFSYRGLFRKNWHLTWSKLYWKSLGKGIFSSKKLALRNMVRYFLKLLISLLSFNINNTLINAGSCVGAGSFLFGFKAFDKNGNARG